MINLTDSISACTASGILAYAKQIYHQMSGGTGTNVEDLLNDHDAKIQSAIKLDEYNEVNITYPFNEEHEGNILCNLTKDDDKIIQDHSDWGSEFADYVRSSNLYIATNMGNTGIGILGDDFTGYVDGEEIASVYDSSDKSTIVGCFQSASDYWIVETESELTGLTSSNNLYYSIGTYHKKSDKTPFRLDQDGSLYLLHVGGYDGDKNTAHNSQSLQEVIGELEEQIASASTSGSNLSLDENSNLLVNEKYITVDGSDNFLKAGDYISYNLSGSSSEYNLELYGGYMYRDFHYQFVKFLEDAEILDESGQTVATITNATYESSTKNITITTDPDLGDLYNNNFYLRNQNIAVSSICLGGFLNKGDYSTLIGYDNYNTGSGNMTLGSGNANDGQGTVIVGYYNSIQNEHNGYPCYIFGEYNKANDDSMLCVLGSHNESTGDYLESFGLGSSIKFTRGINVGNDILRQVGIGVGLDISQNEFVIGQFNKDYDIAGSSKKNFFTVGNGTEFTKSNSLEQKVNGDLYILGLGGFDGTNSLSASTKSLQAKITELENTKDLFDELNAKMNVLMDDMDVEARFAYGVQWDKTATSPGCTRVGNMLLHAMLPVQSQMRGCLLNDNGEVVKYLAESGWTEETLDGSMGQVMVEIPKFYWKFTESGNTQTVMLSQVPIEGYTKVPKRYVSAYEATIDNNGNTGTTNSNQYKLASVKNTTARYRGCNNVASNDETYKSGLGMPRTNLSLQTFRESARRRKPGTYEWNCYDYMTHKILYWLFVVEFATRHTQKAVDSTTTISGYKNGGLGNGVTTVNSTEWSNLYSNYPIVPCGTSDSLGNGTGEVSYTVPSSGAGDTWTTVTVPRYRGIENPFGHIWKQTDGIKVEVESGGTTSRESKVYVCYTPSKYNSTSDVINYNYIGNEERSQGNVKEIIFGSSGDLLTSVNGGGASTYYGDYHYVKIDNTATEYRSVRFGGTSANGASAGFVCTNSHNGLSSAYTNYGSRLCFIPDAT